MPIGMSHFLVCLYCQESMALGNTGEGAWVLWKNMGFEMEPSSAFYLRMR